MFSLRGTNCASIKFHTTAIQIRWGGSGLGSGGRDRAQLSAPRRPEGGAAVAMAWWACHFPTRLNVSLLHESTAVSLVGWPMVSLTFISAQNPSERPRGKPEKAGWWVTTDTDPLVLGNKRLGPPPRTTAVPTCLKLKTNIL